MHVCGSARLRALTVHSSQAASDPPVAPDVTEEVLIYSVLVVCAAVVIDLRQSVVTRATRCGTRCARRAPRSRRVGKGGAQDVRQWYMESWLY